MNKFLFLLLSLSSIAMAQDLTGRWVAITSYDSGYYAELYLVQNNENVYAGHCYDTEDGGYCRHWLDAKFNPETNEFIGLDMELIAKSESHAPTDYILKYEKDPDGKEYLVGTSAILPYGLRPLMLGLPTKEDLYMLRFRVMQGSNFVRYVKVEEDYTIYNDDMPLAMTPDQILLEKSAFPEVFDTNELALQEPVEEFEENPTIVPSPPKTITPEAPEVVESLPEIEDEPIISDTPIDTSPEREEPTILEKKENRTDRLLSHIKVKTQKVTLLIRDYGTIDNDSVTIFYNDKIIAENLRIESKAAEFELELLPNRRNELVFVANNLGDVAPNTAKITLISDEKRYNYKLFTDEENNALILLENIAK